MKMKYGNYQKFIYYLTLHRITPFFQSIRTYVVL